MAVVLLGLSNTAFSSPDVGELLKKVASTCRNFYLHGYVVDITRHQISLPHYDTGGIGADHRVGVPSPIIHKPSAGDRIVLARSGRSLRYELRDSLGEIFEWTTDERTIWCYRRDLNA
ncbi:MAG: hypothetical protein ACRD9L_27210 [Bryobacteraceae bacterium]